MRTVSTRLAVCISARPLSRRSSATSDFRLTDFGGVRRQTREALDANDSILFKKWVLVGAA